jgi:hypothetical protein
MDRRIIGSYISSFAQTACAGEVEPDNVCAQNIACAHTNLQINVVWPAVPAKREKKAHDILQDRPEDFVLLLHSVACSRNLVKKVYVRAARIHMTTKDE